MVTKNFSYQNFARFSVPDTIVSDNWTQFITSEFKVFCKSLAIEHITMPSYHPISNRQAEHFINTFKRALKKSEEEEADEVMLL